MDFCLINEKFGYTPIDLKEESKTRLISYSSIRPVVEWVAVVSNLLFTILYLNQNEWAFFMGIAGPLLLIVLSWKEKLYAEPVLQGVYILSAIVGWFNVQSGWEQLQLNTAQHILLFTLSIALAFIWGLSLKRFTKANFPKLDALTASLGMVATWLMMYQVHACWLYLMAVNLLSIFIYFRRRLFIAAWIFVLYFIMSVDGYFQMHWCDL
jgi:nicotinamide mononucleotide transporter